MFAIVAMGALAACSDSQNGGNDNSCLADAPGTEVYVGVEALNNLSKVEAATQSAALAERATENPLAPMVTVSYFNVKIDPRLGYVQRRDTYASVVNGGKLYTDCPFIQSTRVMTIRICLALMVRASERLWHRATQHEPQS